MASGTNRWKKGQIIFGIFGVAVGVAPQSVRQKIIKLAPFLLATCLVRLSPAIQLHSHSSSRAAPVSCAHTARSNNAFNSRHSAPRRTLPVPVVAARTPHAHSLRLRQRHRQRPPAMTLSRHHPHHALPSHRPNVCLTIVLLSLFLSLFVSVWFVAVSSARSFAHHLRNCFALASLVPALVVAEHSYDRFSAARTTRWKPLPQTDPLHLSQLVVHTSSLPNSPSPPASPQSYPHLQLHPASLPNSHFSLT